MTAPERRRPLPALAFIGVLCLLTGIVWFRVIHRSDTSSGAPPSKCTQSTHHKPAQPTSPKIVPYPKKVSVLVLNSTNRDGIATRAKKALAKQGFTVTDATNDKPAYGGHGLIKGVGEIRYGPQSLAAATLLRFYFPFASMKATAASSKLVTVSLGQKYKTVNDAKAVHKMMRARHVHFGVPKPTPTKTRTRSCS